MRQIFLDTETTGLYPAQGHRIIEIAAIESINRRVTQNHFHVFLNPDRQIDPAAQEVHGITLDFLQDKPRFEDIASDFIEYISGAELIIHNAPFDVGFLNSELGRIDKNNIELISSSIVDTLSMAKAMRPGQRNNLDALCRYYGIDNSKRTLHGALLDAELLAEVYFSMTRGQESLMIDLEDNSVIDQGLLNQQTTFPILVMHATPDELDEHNRYLDSLSNTGKCIWTDES